jgi:hypothetical protein
LLSGVVLGVPGWTVRWLAVGAFIDHCYIQVRPR